MHPKIEYERSVQYSMLLAERLPETRRIMAAHSIRFPKPEDFKRLHKTFQTMIDVPIAPDESVQAVHNHTGQCVFLLEGKNNALTGSMLLIQLTHKGLERVQTGRPLGHNVNHDWICPPQDVPAALLVWGLLGQTPMASGRILRFSLELARTVYHDIPILTYAATSDGARIMQRVGFRATAVPGVSELDMRMRRGGDYD